MIHSRYLLFLLAGLSVQAAIGQALSGQLLFADHPGTIHLLDTRGTSHSPIDSTTVDRYGIFVFRPGTYNAGFYQLAVNDSDRVDIILDPREEHVELEFNGIPIQEHIRVVRSDENRMLWEFKAHSRNAQTTISDAEAKRAQLQPNDLPHIHALDSIIEATLRAKEIALFRIIQQAPSSYFAKVVVAGKQIEVLRGKEPLAVIDAFAFDDPSLLMSSVYPQAVMTFLRNMQPVSEEQFITATDTLIAAASGHPDTRRYMIEHLVDLFGTYGPDLALQHLVDRHIIEGPVELDLSPEVIAKVREMQQVSTGKIGPDILLPRPGRDTVWLHQFTEEHELTVLFFYSSTCDHCHEQLPVLNELYSTHAPNGLEIIGIALDEDRAEFEAMLEREHIPWPSFTELVAWGSPAAKAYVVQATPSFFLLDKERRIVAKPYDAEAAREAIERHLKD